MSACGFCRSKQSAMKLHLTFKKLMISGTVWMGSGNRAERKREEEAEHSRGQNWETAPCFTPWQVNAAGTYR